MNISRVELFCDDKNVGMLLRALAGVALETPKVVPVVNAEVQNGRIVAKTKIANGDQAKLFAIYLLENKLKQVNAGHVKAFLRSLGKREHSYSYIVRQSQDYGLLRKKGGKGSKTGYTVVTRVAKALSEE